MRLNYYYLVKLGRCTLGRSNGLVIIRGVYNDSQNHVCVAVRQACGSLNPTLHILKRLIVLIVPSDNLQRYFSDGIFPTASISLGVCYFQIIF